MPEKGPIFFFDGLCAFCNGMVRFSARLDWNARLRFASLQGETAQRELASLQGSLPDSMLLWSGGKVYAKSEAFFETLRILGGFWRLFLVLHSLPLGLRDAAYDLVASRRKKLFGAYDSCPVPPLSLRNRFLP